jgi:ribosomal protein L37AE/L43A
MNSEINIEMRNDETPANAGNSSERGSVVDDASMTLTRNCPACGTSARRRESRYCATCGRNLTGGYLPADALRASYHQQPRPAVVAVAEQRINSNTQRTSQTQRNSHARAGFPMKNLNTASTTALAFVTYALVPYLGILFCPGAIVMGSVGLLRSYQSPQLGGRRACYTSIFIGVLIFGAQVFLWWILYKVPQWNSGL